MNFNRRNLLTAAGAALGAAGVVSRTTAAEQATSDPRTERGIIDCQSHLFFPQVLNAMRQRTADPLVYDEAGTTYLKMGPWLRKVPPLYYDVDAKLAAMDAAGIEATLLSNNDPGPAQSTGPLCPEAISGFGGSYRTGRCAGLPGPSEVQQRQLPPGVS
jgi:hypothetical protein